MPGVRDAERGVLVADDDAAAPAADGDGELAVLLLGVPDRVDQHEPTVWCVLQLGPQEDFDGTPAGDGPGGRHRPSPPGSARQEISTGVSGCRARNASISSRTAVRSAWSAAVPGAMTRRAARRGPESPGAGSGSQDSGSCAGAAVPAGSGELGFEETGGTPCRDSGMWPAAVAGSGSAGSPVGAGRSSRRAASSRASPASRTSPSTGARDRSRSGARAASPMRSTSRWARSPMLSSRPVRPRTLDSSRQSVPSSAASTAAALSMAWDRSRAGVS